MKWAAVTLLLLLLLAAGKKGQNKQDIKRAECQRKESCKLDESDNCINHCISATCFNKVYATALLEPGEIDRSRSTKFSECLRVDERMKRREDL
jgi:hypothetical protein